LNWSKICSTKSRRGKWWKALIIELIDGMRGGEGAQMIEGYETVKRCRYQESRSEEGRERAEQTFQRRRTTINRCLQDIRLHRPPRMALLPQLKKVMEFSIGDERRRGVKNIRAQRARVTAAQERMEDH